MKITEKNLQYILLLLILAIGFGAYRFGYMTYSDKASAFEQENKQLQQRLAELTMKESRRGEYETMIQTATLETNEILAKYGPGNSPEKSILFATQLEKQADLSIETMAFYEDTPQFFSTEANEDGTSKIIGSGSALNISFNTSYNGLKKAMDFINHYGERMNVKEFTAVYNQETGGISGNMNLMLYSVADETHQYAAPEVIGIQLGTQNIFQSMDLDQVRDTDN